MGSLKKNFYKISGISMSYDDMQCAYRQSYIHTCVPHTDC